MNIQAVLESIKKGVQDIVDQVLASFKISKKITSLQSEDQIKLFIQQRSAYVTQTTLYGYLKTRIGTRYLSMFEDQVFSESIDIAKWNIYVTALADCTLYVNSYLVSKKGLKENSAEKIFNEIIEDEKKNGLNEKLANETKIEFAQRLREVNWQSYHAEDPFIKSGYALYRWSPIADELKVLDKEIVLNSIMLKWNLVKNEFLELTDKFENI